MFILEWLEIAVSWILVTFHALLSPIFGAASGAAWGLSIVGLVIVIRTLLIPLFVKQIKAQRNLQILQPQMKEIQKKYAGDKERQSQEMMKLYRETGTNPLSSCLPILVQAPIFFALFRVLQGMAQNKAVGVLTPELVEQGREASILGVPIYGTFMNADETPNPTATRVVTLVMIILMSATTFITQRQLIVKNTAADNPMVRQQKLLLVHLPRHVRRRWYQLPARCSDLLVDHQPVVHGPAVLGDPKQSTARHSGPRCQDETGRGQGCEERCACRDQQRSGSARGGRTPQTQP